MHHVGVLVTFSAILWLRRDLVVSGGENRIAIHRPKSLATWSNLKHWIVVYTASRVMLRYLYIIFEKYSLKPIISEVIFDIMTVYFKRENRKSKGNMLGGN